MESGQARNKWKALFSLAIACGMLSACLQPLTATPLPTQEVVRVTLPQELAPLKPAIQSCSQAQPGMALFEETGDAPADIRFVLGEPSGLEGVAVKVAREQIRVIVNPQNPIQALTQADLVDLYTGRKSSWAEVGGESAQAVLWTYPSGDPLREHFDRLLLAGNRPAGSSFLAPSPEAMREAVSQDPAAIGFLPAAWLDDSIKPVELEPNVDQALRQPVLALTAEEPQGTVLRLLACLQSGAGRDEILQSYPLTGAEE